MGKWVDGKVGKWEDVNKEGKWVDVRVGNGWMLRNGKMSGC